jgi:hypothetical protein
VQFQSEQSRLQFFHHAKQLYVNHPAFASRLSRAELLAQIFVCRGSFDRCCVLVARVSFCLPAEDVDEIAASIHIPAVLALLPADNYGLRWKQQ